MRWITLAALCLATEAAAQAPCDNAASSPLAAARRARSALTDAAEFRGVVGARRQAMMAADVANNVKDRMIYQAFLADQVVSVSGYDLCGASQSRKADLVGGWFGLGLELVDTTGQWSVSWMMLLGGDSLSPTDFTASDDQPVSPEAVGRGYTLWALEARITEWASVGLGAISDARAAFAVGTDDEGSSVSNSSFETTGEPPRYFVRLGVPRIGASATVMLDDQGTLDFGDLGVSDVPLPWVPELSVGAAVRRLGFEAISTTEVNVAYSLWAGKVRPSVVGVAAWPDGRLRTLAARVDGGIGGTTPFLGGWAMGGVDLFAELSRFSSAAVDAAGGGVASGYQLGGAVRGGFRWFELELNGSVGQNRVATLTRLPDASNRTEFTVGFFVRLGG